ncbi:MAG: hypothetical protein ACT4QC_21235 [Planctomycetaceae bacterium]
MDRSTAKVVVGRLTALGLHQHVFNGWRQAAEENLAADRCAQLRWKRDQGGFHELATIEKEGPRKFRVLWEFEKRDTAFGVELFVLDFYPTEINPNLTGKRVAENDPPQGP